MSHIRPDEVSSILKDQIAGFSSAASLEEVPYFKLEMVLPVFMDFSEFKVVNSLSSKMAFAL
jgi:hypothetical protein